MKKNLIVLCGFVMFALVGCATTGGTSSSFKPKTAEEIALEKVGDAIKSAKPAAGETWSIDVYDNAEIFYSADAFYASSIYLTLDEKLNLSSKLSDEQKVAFARALMKDVPYFEEGKDVRAIVVGDVFPEQEENKNLIVIVSIARLKEGVIPGVKFAYEFLTNAVVTTNKETGEVKATCTGTFMTSSFNYSIIAVPFENGMLVKAGDLNLGAQKYSSDMSDVDKGNIIDTFVKDEIVENDAQIESIYNELLPSNDLLVGKVLAPLNYGLYLAKQKKLDEAKNLWNSIDLTSLPNESEQDKNTIESLKYVFDHDIVNYLNILENF